MWLERLRHAWFGTSPTCAKRGRRRPRLRPVLEHLEDRTLPAPLLVTSAADPAGPLVAGTLRYAVNQANQDAIVGQSDTITFDTHAMRMSTVTLAQGPLVLDVSGAVVPAGTETIDGTEALHDGGGHVTISGNHASGVFRIASGVQAALTRLEIQDGNSGGDGGGIFNAGTLTVSNAFVAANSAVFGGGIFNNGTLTVSNAHIAGNSAVFGGGIFNNGTLTMSKATFGEFPSEGNSAISGGGIFNNGGTVTVSNATLEYNSALVDGGCVWNDGGTVTLSNANLNNNSAKNGGGSIFNNSGTVAVSNATLSGNLANDGGGIFNAGTLTVSNATLSGNFAQSGGAIYNRSGTATVSNATLSCNFAGLGGGIVNAGGLLILRSTIVAANTAPSAPDVFEGGTDGGSTYNLVGDGTTSGLSDGVNSNHVGSAARPIDPRLTAPTNLLRGLDNYGGPTQTLALLPGSRAIANGGPAGPGVPTTDQRGLPRPTSGPIDVGAFQTQAGPFVVTIAGGGISGKLSLREAVNLANAVPGSNTITFDTAAMGTSFLTGNTIVLSGTGGTQTIDGGGLVTFSGNHRNRLFVILSGVQAVLTGLTIQDGHSSKFGGGILNSGRLTVSNATLSGNSVGPLDGSGGQESQDGGAIYDRGPLLALSNVTLSGNSAARDGGGIFNVGGTLTVNNTTLSGNSAGQDGGGIYNNSGVATVNNATLSGNSAGVEGGGIYNVSGADLQLQSTIVAANTAPSAPDLLVEESNDITSIYSLIGDGSGSSLVDGFDYNQVGSTASPIDPRLAPLGNYGGSTQTLALLPGSRAIANGLGNGERFATGAHVPTTDQRGFPRPTSGPIDVGAFQTSLVVRGDQNGVTNDTIDLRLDPNNEKFLQVVVNSSVQYDGPYSFLSITIDGGAGHDTINVEDVPDSIAVTTIEGDTGVVNVGKAGRVSGIRGPLTVTNPLSFTTLNVDDSADTSYGSTVTITNAAITGLAPGTIKYQQLDLAALNIHAGSGIGNTFTVTNTPDNGLDPTDPNFLTTTLTTGSQNDTVAVQATSGPLNVNSGSGNATINVGATSNRLDGIQGALAVNGQAGTTMLNVNDDGSFNVPNYAVTAGTITRTGAAPITYSFLSSLVLNAGFGDSTIDIMSGVQTPVIINTQGSNNTVNAGTPGNHLINIVDLTVNGRGAAGVPVGTTLNLFDQANTDGPNFSGMQGPTFVQTRPTYLVTDRSITRSDARTITDLSTGQVLSQFNPVGTFRYNVNVTSVNLYGGLSPNVFNVESTAAGTPVRIDSLGSNDTVTVGSTGTVANIKGAVDVRHSGASGVTALYVQDGSDPVPKTNVILDDGSLTGLAPAPITWTPAPNGAASGGVGELRVTGGGGYGGVVGNIFTVNNTSLLYHGTFLAPGYGSNQVNVRGTTGQLIVLSVLGGHNDVTLGSQAPSLGATLANINGPVYILDQTQTALTLDNSGDTSPAVKTVTFGFDGTYHTVSGLAPATIFYTPAAAPALIGVTQLTVYGGSGPNVFAVQSTAAGAPVTINTGSGNNIVNVGSTLNQLDPIQGALTVNGQPGGSTTLNVNDQGTSTGQTYTLDSNTLTRAPFASSGAVSQTITYTSLANLALHAGRGSNNLLAVKGTAAGTKTDVYGGTGTNAENEFVVSNNLVTLDSMQGTLGLHGQSGNSFVLFNDSLNFVSQTYTLTTGTLNRTGMAPITYDGLVEDIVATSEKAGAVVNVQSNAANVTTVVGIDEAGDPVTVGSLDPALGWTLANIQGSVLVEGLIPSVVIDDSGDKTAHAQAAFKTDTYYPNAYDLVGLAPGTLIFAIDPATPIDIKGGSGGNTFTIANPLPATGIKIDGGGGINTLVFNDQVTTADETYTVTATTVGRTGSGPITYANMSNLGLYAGTGSNTLNINSTAAGTKTDVYGGTGANGVAVDQFVVANAVVTLDSIQGPLGLHGQSTNSYVLFNDSVNFASQTYTLTSGTLNRTGMAAITYDGLGVDVLYTSEKAVAAVNVLSNAALETAILDQGGDSVTVGSLAPGLGGTLANIQGLLVISSLPGQTASVVIDDSGDKTAHAQAALNTYTYGYNLTGLAPGTIDFGLDPATPVSILGGTGNDTFTVANPLPATGIQIDGGGGTNTLVGPNTANTWNIKGQNRGTLGSVAFANFQNLVGGAANDTFNLNNLDDAPQTLTIAGGGGTNSLNVNDQASAKNRSYNLTASVLTRTDVPLTVNYANVQNLAINAGSGTNAFTGSFFGNANTAVTLTGFSSASQLTSANLQSTVSAATPGTPVVLGVDPKLAGAMVAAINWLAPQATAVTVVLNLAPGTYSDLNASPPKGVTLVINGNGSTTTIVGHSPALTVTAGIVVVTGMTFSTATDSPTILVSGGSLKLRNDVIQETTGGNQAAVQITGGTVDLGTTPTSGGDPGLNILNINGSGQLIDNTGPNPVAALGDTFEVNGVVLTSPYAIEDKIFHALDEDGGGLVIYVANNVYVTQESGSIQRAIDAVPAGYTVNVQAAGQGQENDDRGNYFDDYTVGGKPLTVAFQNGPTLQLAADSALAPNSTTLRVTGPAHDHTHIAFERGDRAGAIDVTLDDLPTGTFAPSGGIVAHGGGGKKARIEVDRHIMLPTLLFADGADAHLEGGGGTTVEVGGGGDHTHLEGGRGRNLLIAGPGAAHLEGNRADDILIGGTVNFGANYEAALSALIREWARTDEDFATRVANITGDTSSPQFTANRLNGSYYLQAHTTVFDNLAPDHLKGGKGHNLFFADLSGANQDQLNGVKAKDEVIGI